MHPACILLYLLRELSVKMRSYIFSVFLLCLSCAVEAQEVVINMEQSNSAYAANNYYITEVIDDRNQNGSVGKIKEGELMFKNGLSETLTEYFQSETEDNDKVPVSMHIKQLEITETNSGLKRQFNIKLNIAYYIGSNKLIEYSGSAYNQSRGGYKEAIYRLITDNIISNMKGFDSWVYKNKDKVTAKPTIDVEVILATRPDNANYIMYSTKRKLYITDFQAEPDDLSIGAAATSSGIGMNYTSSTLYNHTKLTVTVTVYFDRSRSWMKENGKNATTLMHEQVHFDITAIKGCELKQRIEQAELRQENYTEQLKELLYTVQEEGDKMQKQYDKETQHGTIIDKQQEWKKKVAYMVKQQTCF